ncbi:MAG: hypothetical protein CMO66_07375 [Verrucomicrobiales bacterium]|nr:hypothetical protein [Verrucomicrobiales bacterium]
MVIETFPVRRIGSRSGEFTAVFIKCLLGAISVGGLSLRQNPASMISEVLRDPLSVEEDFILLH